MWLRADSDVGRRAAVIDVGSNSVRLVMYRLEGRAIWTIFNEKSLAGLGRDLPSTGRLSPDGVEEAIASLRRFRALLDGWKREEIYAVATAAVREAEDGQAFLARIRDEVALDVRLLSGAEEAHYAALGVIAGDPGAQGVVGDLGGSSLELIRLYDGTPGAGVTLPLGPFALGAPRPLDIDKARKAVTAQLSTVAGQYDATSFHAVGGAWRNLALLHMELADYPLRVAHQYEIGRNDLVDLVRFVSRQSARSLEGIAGLSKKRYDTLPYAALVLDCVLEKLDVERVIFSAYGLREGLLLDSMEPGERVRDPLIAGCEALTDIRGLSRDLGASLEAWLAPAFAKLPPVFKDREPILLGAACRLADIGARLHPDHRADLVFDQVLRAPLAGMSHAERTFLACAAFSRYTAASAMPQAATVARLLGAERRQRARALGAAVRLGCDLSGRNARLLAKADIDIDGDRLVMSAQPGWRDMMLGEQTAKRAATLASLLKLKLVLA